MLCIVWLMNLSWRHFFMDSDFFYLLVFYCIPVYWMLLNCAFHDYLRISVVDKFESDFNNGLNLTEIIWLNETADVNRLLILDLFANGYRHSIAASYDSSLLEEREEKLNSGVLIDTFSNNLLFCVKAHRVLISSQISTAWSFPKVHEKNFILELVYWNNIFKKNR